MIEQKEKSLLRFITCGSVDDGKSTLIGRLLYETKSLYDDQLEALSSESIKWGTQGTGIDYALLVDGLSAEREQGITIDVAYRYFSTDKRKFIVADTPGHEQYTRNMITGASTADLALVLVDGRKGLLTQTKRHSFLLSKIGVKNILIVINKMDTIDYEELKYKEIRLQFQNFSKDLGFESIHYIPVSALKGDNITEKSRSMPWYDGYTLLEFLEKIELETEEIREQFDLRFQVQWVNRSSSDFRGYAGTISSGVLRPGSKIKVQPSGVESKISRIITKTGDLDEAIKGEAVIITLDDEIDISRGDVICSAENSVKVSNHFQVDIFWMNEEELLPGRVYLIKFGTNTITGSITSIKHEININTLEKISAKTLKLNSIGSCNMSVDKDIPYETYIKNRDLGSFIIIDRYNFKTLGAGTINFSLNRAENIHASPLSISKKNRSEQKNQKACVIWLTGISGAGKSTLANLLDRNLYQKGYHSYILDGDNLRRGLNKDLGFTATDRVENIRRAGEVAKLMTDAGLIVIASFISPFKRERDRIRSQFDKSEFYEIFLDIPFAVAKSRDPKGLYKKADEGKLKNFTGMDSPYEKPEFPSLKLDTDKISQEQACNEILDLLKKNNIIKY